MHWCGSQCLKHGAYDARQRGNGARLQVASRNKIKKKASECRGAERPLQELGSGSEVSVLLRRHRRGAPDCKDEGTTNVSPLRRSRLVPHLRLAAVHACFAVPALEPFGASRC